eukprot:5241675-Prymnesium_polylepis.1
MVAPARADNPECCAAQPSTLAGHSCERETSLPEACPAGSWSDTVGLSSEQQCKECTHEASISLFAPSACKQPIGFYCPEASTSPRGCTKGTYGRQIRLTEAAFCTGCPPHQTSSQGSASCTMCVEDYYKVVTDELPTGSFDCKSCAVLPGSTCAENTSVADVGLLPGRWRLSGASEQIVQCERVSSSDVNNSWWTPCKGGSDPGFEGAGYCQPGHAGPRCQLCTEPSQHYLEGHCQQCPSVGGRVMLVVGPTAGAILLAVSVGFVVARTAPAAWRWLVSLFNHFAMWLQNVAFMPKLKLVLGFFQTITFMPDV